MTISTTAHLNFPGTARAALDLYRTVFGGAVQATTYGELGAPADSPEAHLIVFGRLDTDAGAQLMAYDVPGRTEPFSGSTRRESGMTLTDQPFFLSVRGETLDEVAGYWTSLAEGATVIEPFAASAWSPGFGMLTDRFGVTWVFDVQA